MISFTQGKNLIAQFCNVSTTDTAKMAILGGYFNNSIKTVATKRKGKWSWLFKAYDIPTIAGQRGYPIPQRIRRLSSLILSISSNSETSTTRYQPTPIFDQNAWNRVLVSNLGESDWPMFYFIDEAGGTVEIAPIPSSNDNTFTLRGRVNLKDLSIEDYSTGTITAVPYVLAFTGSLADGATSGTLTGAFALTTGTYQIKFSNGETRRATFTNASTAVTWEDELTSAATTAITVSTSTGGSIVTGGSTVWTAPMSGRFIRITDSSTANTGDGFWYEVDTVYSNTILSLTKPYQGTAISAGTAAYVMGQMSPIPESYDYLPIYRSAALYWLNQKDTKRADYYWNLYDGGEEVGKSETVGGLMGQMLEEAGQIIEGAYISPNLISTRLSPNDPQQVVASSSFS